MEFRNLMGVHAELVGKVAEHLRAGHGRRGELVLVRRVGRVVGVARGPSPLKVDVELRNGAAVNV